MKYEYSAINVHREIPQETRTCNCSMCGEEITTFFVGWTMNEYEDDHRVCGEWDCWREFASYHESEIPFEDYLEDVDNMTDDDWNESVSEWLWNAYDIKKSDRWNNQSVNWILKLTLDEL